MIEWPNPAFDRSPQRRRHWIPVALRALAPGNANVSGHSTISNWHSLWSEKENIDSV